MSVDELARTRWFAIRRAADGEEILLPTNDDVRVVARDEDGRIVLIEEPSSAFGGVTILLPGGALEQGEDVLERAQSELREETGLAARTLRPVGVLRPWSRYLQLTMHVVFAEGLFASSLPADETHAIRVLRKTRDEIMALIAAGEIKDAGVIAALALCLMAESPR